MISRLRQLPFRPIHHGRRGDSSALRKRRIPSLLAAFNLKIISAAPARVLAGACIGKVFHFLTLVAGNVQHRRRRETTSGAPHPPRSVRRAAPNLAGLRRAAPRSQYGAGRSRD